MSFVSLRFGVAAEVFSGALKLLVGGFDSDGGRLCCLLKFLSPPLFLSSFLVRGKRYLSLCNL